MIGRYDFYFENYWRCSETFGIKLIENCVKLFEKSRLLSVGSLIRLDLYKTDCEFDVLYLIRNTDRDKEYSDKNEKFRNYEIINVRP